MRKRGAAGRVSPGRKRAVVGKANPVLTNGARSDGAAGGHFDAELFFRSSASILLTCSLSNVCRPTQSYSRFREPRDTGGYYLPFAYTLHKVK